MDRSLEESHQEACNNGEASANSSQRINRFLREFPYPPLNLTLTITPEFISSIESVLKEPYPCPYQQESPTLTRPQTPRLPEKKQKTLTIHFTKIKIGRWTHVSKNTDDLTAKFYFKRKKLMWEFLRMAGTTVPDSQNPKKKIEMNWTDVLSLKLSNLPDGTEVLEIELSNPPTFFEELPTKATKAAQWKQLDHDFTLDNSASICRRHTLHFAPGDLKKNLEKLASGNSFWSNRFKVSFPRLQSPYFDLAFGKNNNNGNYTDHSYPDHYNPTYSFNVNTSDLHHRSHQGFGHMGVGEGNFSMATQFGDNAGRQRNPFVQANNLRDIANEFCAMEAIQQPWSQQHYFPGESSTGPHLCNRVSQGMNQLPQVFPDPLLETQANSTTIQNMDELSTYPQVGSYAADIIFCHQEERQNHEQDFADYIDQLLGNVNDGSLPPDY